MTTSHSVKSILIRDKCSMVIVKGMFKIDYTKEANGEAFFLPFSKGTNVAVKNLTSSNGMVIESGPDDNIFVVDKGRGSSVLLVRKSRVRFMLWPPAPCWLGRC